MDEMFYQIPEILLCHEFFLKQLQARMNEWHDKQKIGDIFVSSVRTFLQTSKGDNNDYYFAIYSRALYPASSILFLH